MALAHYTLILTASWSVKVEENPWNVTGDCIISFEFAFTFSEAFVVLGMEELAQRGERATVVRHQSRSALLQESLCC